MEVSVLALDVPQASQEAASEDKTRKQRIAAGVGRGLCGAIITAGFWNGIIGSDGDVEGFEYNARATVGSGFSLSTTGFDIAMAPNTAVPIPGIDVTVDDLPLPESINKLAQTGDIEAVGKLIYSDAYRELLLAGAVGGVALGVGGGRLRREFGSVTKRQVGTVTATTLAATTLMGVGGLYPSIDLQRGGDWKPAAGAVEEFPWLENIYVRGAYAEKFVDILQESERFYTFVEEGVVEKALSIQEEAKQYDILIYETDLHCRKGMAKSIGALAVNLDAFAVANGGDKVHSGMSGEKLCTQIYAQRVPKPIIIAPGNHDSQINVDQFRDEGMIVLDRKPIEVNGYTFIGDSDPRVDIFGKPQMRRDERSDKKFGQELTVATLRAKEMNPTLIVHDITKAGNAPAYADLTLHGHFHDPLFDPEARTYRGGSSGGKEHNKFPYIYIEGEMDHNATIAAVYFDKSTKRAVGIREFTITPTGEVSVSELMQLNPGEEFTNNNFASNLTK